MGQIVLSFCASTMSKSLVEELTQQAPIFWRSQPDRSRGGYCASGYPKGMLTADLELETSSWDREPTATLSHCGFRSDFYFSKVRFSFFLSPSIRERDVEGTTQESDVAAFLSRTHTHSLSLHLDQVRTSVVSGALNNCSSRE